MTTLQRALLTVIAIRRDPAAPYRAQTFRQNLMRAVLMDNTHDVRRLLIPLQSRWRHALRRWRCRKALGAALCAAVESNHLEALDLLLPLADSCLCNDQGDTALHLAFVYGRVDALQRLLPVSDPRRTARDGTTPIVLAAQTNRADLVTRWMSLIRP